MASYTAHTTVCVDMALPGVPITTLGVKPIDAHVNSVDQAFLLEDYKPFIPAPISGTWLYTLKQDGSVGFTTNEIQRRDLLDRVAHTFTTYAKIPSSMWADMHDGVQKTNAWITIINDVIYLMSFIDERVNAGTGATVGGKSSVWRLDGVDISGDGVFTLIHQTTTTGDVTGYYLFAARGIADRGFMPNVSYTWQPDYGHFDRAITSVSTSVTDHSGTTYSGQSSTTMTNRVSFTPWFYDGTAFVDDKGVTRTTTVNFILFRINSNVDIYGVEEACSYDIIQQYTGLTTDNYGNSVVVSPHYLIHSAGTPPPSSSDFLTVGFIKPILNGKLLGSSMFGVGVHTKAPYPVVFNVISYQYYNNFAFELNSETVYVDYNAYFRTGGVTTSIVVDCQDLITRAYTGPLSNGSDKLEGVWGYGNTVVMNTNALNKYKNYYSLYYVCKASDTSFTNKYSVFSKVNADGTILHLEGVEDVTPSLWLDNTKLSDLNGPGVSALYTMGENIYKFNTSRDMVSMTYVSPDLNFDSRHERKRFKFLEFHGRGSAAVRVFVDGRLVNSGNVDATENPSKGRKYLLPRGTRGYTLRFEVSGKIEIRLVEIGYEPMPWTS